MKERPILFTAEMVRAILDGRKTQTRRPVRAYMFDHIDLSGAVPELRGKYQFLRTKNGGEVGPVTSPFGQPGDRLWVREPARVDYVRDEGEGGMELAIRYVADDVVRLVEVPERLDIEWQRKYKEGWPVPKWVSGCQGIPNGVFREASRITLDFKVRVERVQDISEADAIAEGIVDPRLGTFGMSPETLFKAVWKSLYGPLAWAVNPWVWVVEFRRIEA